jgi:hypothetical protein
VPGYSTLITAVAQVFYLWVETGSIFRPAGIIADPCGAALN